MTRGSQNGFTLVEVLAALALASLVLVSLNLAMTAIRQAGERARQSLGGQAALAAATAIFQRDVAAIIPIRRAASGAAAGYLFEASPRQMVYPLAEQRGAGAGGLYLVRLSVRQEEGRSLLLRERRALEPGAADATGAAGSWTDGVVLLEGPYEIAFAYRAPGAGTRGWREGWPSPGPLPEQVRLTIADTATGRLRLPVLVQPLLLTAPAECAADPACAAPPQQDAPPQGAAPQ